MTITGVQAHHLDFDDVLMSVEAAMFRVRQNARPVRAIVGMRTALPWMDAMQDLEDAVARLRDAR